MGTDFYLPRTSESVITQHRFEAADDLSWRPKLKREPTARNFNSQNILDFEVSPWCISARKRAFDLACVIPALILISPLLGILAIAVRLSSPGPIIFRQQRGGQHKKLFTIYKFRTMVENSETIGPEHTAKGDPRITSLGRILRRFKLDELPQLLNVVRGDMSLVGPRPKLPHHDNTPMVCRPGVTGAATLAFRREQHILCEVPTDQLEEFYQQYVIPQKTHMDVEYMGRATLISDIGLLTATVLRAGRSLTHQDLFSSSCRSTENSSSTSSIALQNN